MAEDSKKSDKKDTDKKVVKKDGKEAAPAADAKPSKAGGLVPIIAAVVVLAGVGGGGGWFLVKSLTPAPVAKPVEAHGANGEPGGEADPHGDAAAPGSKDHGLLANGKELNTIKLKGNVTGSGGTRYVTMEVGIWVPKKDVAELNDASVLRLIQARLEETVKTYQLEDLASPNIQTRMKKDFGVAVERLLRSVKPERQADEKFVLEVIVTELLTQ